MKKLLTFLVFGAIATSVQASYLMWQVNADDAGDFNANAVRIGYSTDGSTTAAGYLTIQDVNDAGDGWDSLGDYVMLDGNKSVPQLYASLDNLTGPQYSYFIELINYDQAGTTVVAVSSQVETYATLTQKGFTGDALTPMIPTAVWHGTPYSVPEPTSAMLVMFGMGLLALKRKRV